MITYGPRQAGKTTLSKQIASLSNLNHVYFTGNDIRTQELFQTPSLDLLQQTIDSAQLIILDEAQRIHNIGLTLKLIHNHLPTRVIATGSSSFDLANHTNEPLTGRTRTFTLYPLSLSELPTEPLDPHHTQLLPQLLRYGAYPRTFLANSSDAKITYLTELLNTYLYKDLLMLDQIRKPKKMIDLLRLLALQLGNEVNIQELSGQLGLAKVIVEKYLDILEKMFVVYNLRGFSRNLRKEVTKTSKYYFYDLGLRNALITNFNDVHLRNDIGALFENFCILERIKHLHNTHQLTNFYFWRTYDQKEIDLIEERPGQLYGYEFNYNPNKTISTATKNTFLTTYPQATLTTVTPLHLNQLITS